MLFASSICDVWIEARYICVVTSESWPMAPLMTWMGTWLDWAMLAQLWRATYRVRGDESCRWAESFFRLRLMA